ncbi:uncharacterized protein LOC132270196 [Cornus florida]|uniref:uncharacterized protein LOC132270196 n=1 Tax=Cornus florida TaxID=4283 RepID=UPI0028A1B589|nr:uncharacterized protein LOC132270196 [Cornus florida]
MRPLPSVEIRNEHFEVNYIDLEEADPDDWRVPIIKFLMNLSTNANGQAEASNKVIISIIEKMIEKYPWQWHNLLSEALCAYKNSKRSSTKVTPYMLTYGHDAVLPMEMTVKSARVAFKNKLTPTEYTQAMLVELEDLDEVRLSALDYVIAKKKKVI